MKAIPRLGRVLTTSYSQGEIQLVEVQVLIRKGLPKIDIIGLPQSMIREGKDRILSALSLMGIDLPSQKILVSLNPGDLRKEGSHFDLPILLGILKAMGILDPTQEKDFAWGELNLDGSIRPMQNILAHLMYANSFRASKLYAHTNNDTSQFIRAFTGKILKSLEHACDLINPELFESYEASPSMHDVSNNILKTWIDSSPEESLWNSMRGTPQQFLLWSLASLGRHHLLVEGSPGVGKSAWSLALKEIQLPLVSEEIIEKFKISPHETSKIKSIADLVRAPYESPHHSSSVASIVGGGSQNISIGYITRAHRGILFLDEIAEFPKNVIEALREPLENKTITLGRTGTSKIFPADIQLIAAMNPCPCGNHLSKKQCFCGTKKFYDYQAKISEPMRDRFHFNIAWAFENYKISEDFKLKAVRARLLEVKDKVPKFESIQISQDLSPRRQKKWLEFFTSWCQWHGVHTATQNDQKKFNEFTEVFEIPKLKDIYARTNLSR